jgi:predicted CoA-binding protein
MDHDQYDDDYIKGILDDVHVIAMVGASANRSRPSYFAMKYLQRKGYRVIPVNPGQAGNTILGETVYATLDDVPEKIDMVDCFRGSDAIPAIAEDAIRLKARVLWMQLSVHNEDAAKTAEAAGLRVVMDRCPKIEYGRLSGEIAWLGVNTGVISSKRTRRM